MQEIVMPSLGMAPGDVYLTEWLVQPGAGVSAGEDVALVETDKSELSVAAPIAGVLGRHRLLAGESAAGGTVVAYVLAEDETETDETEADGETDAAVTSRADRVRDPLTEELSPYTISPRARVAATGQLATPGQRATSDQPTAPAADARPDRHRSAVARAVSQSWAEIPHFAVTREIRTEKLQEALRSFRLLSADVTFTDVLLKVYALSLIERFETTEIDLGLAVATPAGVSIPVLRSVATSDLLAVARKRRAAVERAVAGQSNADDRTVPQSTLSNLGAYGVDSFTGIVPVGQTSILTVGASAKRPVVESDTLVVGESMHLTLNVDHREWDGQHAARTLQNVAAIAANPVLLLQLSTVEPK